MHCRADTLSLSLFTLHLPNDILIIKHFFNGPNLPHLRRPTTTKPTMTKGRVRVKQTHRHIAGNAMRRNSVLSSQQTDASCRLQKHFRIYYVLDYCQNHNINHISSGDQWEWFVESPSISNTRICSPVFLVSRYFSHHLCGICAIFTIVYKKHCVVVDPMGFCVCLVRLGIVHGDLRMRLTVISWFVAGTNGPNLDRRMTASPPYFVIYRRGQKIK